MTRSSERQLLIAVCAVSLVLAGAFYALTILVDRLDVLWDPFFILFLGLGCEAAIRLLLTAGLNYDHDRLFVSNRGWFRKNGLDKAILRRDPACRWADLRAYDPANFAIRPGERELVVQHTCTLELVNEWNALLSFLPLLFLLTTDRFVLTLVLLLVLSLGACALSLYGAERARQYRFQVKAGRV